VHVLDQAILTRDFEAFPLSIPASELAKSARVNLLSVASADFEEFVHVKPLVRTGKPFREIVSLARQENIDLIVIATHGRTGLNRMVLGSTAEQVIRHAPCPVLVVRDYQDERRSRELPRPKRQRLHGALKRKAYRHGA
jgi:nucleotide-binding universal stress UspA family protein